MTRKTSYTVAIPGTVLTMSWMVLVQGCNSAVPNPSSSSTPLTTTSLTSTVNPIQSRYAVVSGRTVIDHFLGAGDVNGGTTAPLPGVTVYAMVNGSRVDTVSDVRGMWTFTGIPVGTNATGAGVEAGNTIDIYFDMPGFISQMLTVKLDAMTLSQSETPSANYQVDMGLQSIVPQPLQFTSNVIRLWNDGTNNTKWVKSGQTAGSPNGTANSPSTESIYLADPAAAISLVFNLPVDTVRAGTNFILLKSPANLALAYTGAWNVTGTVFTITPTVALSPSQYSSARYGITFLGPVYSTGTIYSSTAVTPSGTGINFNVMDGTSAVPLLSQAPSLAPEVDTGVPSATGYTTAYAFGNGSANGLAQKSGLVGGGTVTDILDSTSGQIALRYNVNPGMTYKVYSRYVYGTGFGTATDWVNRTSGAGGGGSNDCVGSTYPDSTATCYLASSLYSFGAPGSLISNGGKIQFVVTSTKGGEESPKDTVTPLSISDTQAPYVVAGTGSDWNIRTTALTRPEWFNPVVSGRAKINFNEPMGPTAPTLAALSGGLTTLAATAGTGRWDSTNKIYSQDASLTFAVPATTLSQAHTAGVTRLRVASLGTATTRFMVGDKIIVGPATVPAPAASTLPREAALTISAIDTYNNVITVGALALNHASGEAVRLLDSATANPGLTSYATTVDATTTVRPGSLSVLLTDASKFFPGQSISFYRKDPSGTYNGGSNGNPAVTGYLAPPTASVIDSISGNTVTLTLPLTVGLPPGTLVADSAVTAAEPRPRVATALASTATVAFDSSSATTVHLSDNQFGNAPDVNTTQIAVDSVAGIFVNDVISIPAQVGVNDTISAPALAADTTITLTGNNASPTFFAGDKIDLVGSTDLTFSVADNVADGNATEITAALTTVKLKTNKNVYKGDILRFYEGAFKTAITAEIKSANGKSAGGDSIAIAASNIFSVGEDVVYDDRITSPVGVTVTEIVDSTHIKIGDTGGAVAAGSVLAGLTAGQNVPVGAILYKPLMQKDVVASAETLASQTPTVGAFGTMVDPNTGLTLKIGFSTSSTLTLVRPTLRVLITGFTALIKPNVNISGAGRSFPAGTAVQLVTEAESFVVTAVPNNYALTLNGSILYAHRAGANVVKASQTNLALTAANAVMVGDTIAFEGDNTGSALATTDRFFTQVSAIDTATGQVTLSTTQTGVYDFNSLGHEAIIGMGDAVTVSGCSDSNGIAMSTGSNIRLDLQGAYAQ